MAKTVRTKFTVTQINRHAQYSYEEVKPGEYEKVEQEIQTVKLTPVYSPDPTSENKLFWDATPQGSIELGMINKSAWDAFKLYGEYYVDFTPAPTVASA